MIRFLLTITCTVFVLFAPGKADAQAATEMQLLGSIQSALSNAVTPQLRQQLEQAIFNELINANSNDFVTTVFATLADPELRQRLGRDPVQAELLANYLEARASATPEEWQSLYYEIYREPYIQYRYAARIVLDGNHPGIVKGMTPELLSVVAKVFVDSLIPQ